MIYLLVFLFLNVLLGILIVIISSDKFPYKNNNISSSSNFEDYENIEKIEEVENIKVVKDIAKQEEIQLSVNNEDKVNKLAKQMIPNESNHSSPAKEAAKEMGDRVKEYFEDNPKDASKIFKTMLKKDN